MRDDIMTLIKRRRLQILVHSAIYYRFNESIISDFTYDMWSKELAALQTQYPEEAKLAPLYEAFADFDGSTGFDLPTSEPWVVNKALQLLAYHKKRSNGGTTYGN